MKPHLRQVSGRPFGLPPSHLLGAGKSIPGRCPRLRRDITCCGWLACIILCSRPFCSSTRNPRPSAFGMSLLPNTMPECYPFKPSCSARVALQVSSLASCRTEVDCWSHSASDLGSILREVDAGCVCHGSNVFKETSLCLRSAFHTLRL